jgi:thymidylate synthase
MKPYLDLLREVLEQGEVRADRTGTGTISLFGAQTRYDLRLGFPLVTTKKVLFQAVVRELLWFLQGETNINYSLTQYTKIWDDWSDEEGGLGPIYGAQWRNWGGSPKRSGNQRAGIDQISQVIQEIKTNPDSRRLIVSAWNVSDLPKMALPPCHLLFQFYVSDQYLDCQLYQRSADLALGVPFNIASYALLTHMVAKECRLVPRFFIHTMGDAHIYQNHIEGVRLQLTRAPKPLSWLSLSDKPVLQQTFEDINLDGYEHHPFIKFPVAV